MTSRVHYYAIIVGILLVLPCVMAAQEIETFVFELPSRGASGLKVSPEGDIWFCLGEPTRLMRVSVDGVNCLIDTGAPYGPVEISISPDGTVWLDYFYYIYSYECGLYRSEVNYRRSRGHRPEGRAIDADSRMYLKFYNADQWYDRMNDDIWEVFRGREAVKRFDRYGIESLLVISARECWASTAWKGGGGGLTLLDLEAGVQNGYFVGGIDEYDAYGIYPGAKDSNGLLWVNWGPCIGTFDGEDFSAFAEGEWGGLLYDRPVLSADGTVWSMKWDWDVPLGLARFSDSEERVFTPDDGLLADPCSSPVIDYDGRVWVLCNIPDLPYYEPDIIGLSCISDGGWPPMRLMLHEVATGGTIAVEAQAINNGPVVGVDVYVALEMDGQLLYWPSWQPEPFPVQVNLRPGHNQTATIISAPLASIPPGTYTFHGCMTGRNTQKLIGPLDRKFESLTVEVD